MVAYCAVNSTPRVDQLGNRCNTMNSVPSLVSEICGTADIVLLLNGQSHGIDIVGRQARQ